MDQPVNVKPFRYPGYPDVPVYIHPPCGTVTDAVPGSEVDKCVQAGECDCETWGPWKLIYVQES